MAWSFLVVASSALALMSTGSTAQNTTEPTATVFVYPVPAPDPVTTVVVSTFVASGPGITITAELDTPEGLKDFWYPSYIPSTSNHIIHVMADTPDSKIVGFHMTDRPLHDYEKLVFFDDKKVELVAYTAANISLGDSVDPLPVKGTKYFAILWIESPFPSALGTLITTADMRRRAESTGSVAVR